MTKVSKKLTAKLRAQRARMSAMAEQELRMLREQVHDQLVANGEAGLVDCPIVDQTISRMHRLHALNLPANWEKRIPRYCRDTSMQNAWARKSPSPTCAFSDLQLKPLARMLLAVRAARTSRRAGG